MPRCHQRKVVLTGFPSKRRRFFARAVPGVRHRPCSICTERERPMSLESLVEQVVPHASPEHTGPAWGKIAVIVAAIVALAAAWRYTPLTEYVTPERVAAWAENV